MVEIHVLVLFILCMFSYGLGLLIAYLTIPKYDKKDRFLGKFKVRSSEKYETSKAVELLFINSVLVNNDFSKFLRLLPTNVAPYNLDHVSIIVGTSNKLKTCKDEVLIFTKVDEKA